MKRLLFIFNPHTGGGRLKDNMLAVVTQMAAAGYELTVCPTAGAGDARRLAAEKAKGYDLVVCCGGDGTLNETVHGLLESGADIPLGYIPGGTTNDYASSLELPKSNMVEAARRAVKPRCEFLCDVGCFNHERYFNYVAAFGAFTDVSYSTPQRFKNLVGYLAYLLEGVLRLGDIHPLSVTVNTGEEEFTEEILLGMVSNSTSVAGFSFHETERISLDDGYFELLMVRATHNLAELAALSAALVTRNVDSPYIITRRVKQVEISFTKPTPWTLDGEFGGEQEKVDIHVQRQALRINT